MNTSETAVRYALVSGFLAEHAEFLDGYDYSEQRTRHPELTYEEITHLSVSVRSWGVAAIEVVCAGPDARLLMQRTCKQMGGKWDKDADSYSFQLSRIVNFHGAEVEVTVSADRDAVCTPRTVGTETRVIPAQPERTVTNDVVEWDCPPSLLSLTNE